MLLNNLPELGLDDFAFPAISSALTEPDGLLALGGDLSLPRMHSAYSSGIFPWFCEGEPILWWCPSQRAVLFCEEFHLSRSLRRFHKKTPFRVTINQAFAEVIRHCAFRPNSGTWITNQVIEAWCCLHKTGDAHSVEVWRDQQLVGGLYGMALGKIFCGESMFSLCPNASKTALFIFNQHFHSFGGQLIDCQILNPHTASLGARNIQRKAYLALLLEFQSASITATCWKPARIY